MILRNQSLPFFRSEKNHLLYLYISWTQLNSPPLLTDSRVSLPCFQGKSQDQGKGLFFCFVIVCCPSPNLFFFNLETNVWNRILIYLSFPKIGEVWLMLTLFSGYSLVYKLKAFFKKTIYPGKFLNCSN